MLRILLDENVHLGAAEALRSRGFDAVHVVEAGLQRSSDAMLLEVSIAQGRVLVTRDYSDFAVLVTTLHRMKRSFPGVLYASVSLPAESPGALADAVVRFVSRHGVVPPGTVAWLTAE